MSLRGAKTALHMSSIWADFGNETDTFHEQLEQISERQLKDEPSGG